MRFYEFEAKRLLAKQGVHLPQADGEEPQHAREAGNRESMAGGA